VDTRRDRQVVHILDVGTRREPRGRPIRTGHVIIGRQQGRRVRREQYIARQ